MISSVTPLLPGLRDDLPAPTLRSFYAGPENRRLRWLVEGITAGHLPPEGTSPWVVIRGPSGSGKTHLVRGIAQWWEQQHREDRVVYAQGMDLARQHADAVQLHDMDGFRYRVDTPALLIIDDLDPLAQKWAAQQELVRLLEVRRRHHHMTLVTCRQLYTEAFLPQLVSRLSAALIVPLLAPTEPTRRGLLQHWLAERRIVLSPEALEHVAAQSSANLFHLLGTVQSLGQLARQQPGALGVQQVSDWLGRMAPLAEYTTAEIAQGVARHFHIRLSELRGKSRQAGIVQARSVAMYVVRQLTSQSLEKIGQYFGGRDHTTVLHACRKVEQGRAADGPLAECLKQITQQLRLRKDARTGDS